MDGGQEGRAEGARGLISQPPAFEPVVPEQVEMGKKDDDGGYRAEIPEDAFADALQSIEKIERGKDEPKESRADDAGLAAEDEGDLEAVVSVEIEDEDESGGAQLEQLRTDLEKARREAAETHERMLRVAADADNIRKRALKERDDAIRFGQEGLLRDLLPVADNLERTLIHVPPKGDDPALDALRQGVEMVLRQFLSILESHNVRPVESLGKAFDPKLHEALSREETDQAEPGTVLNEMHKGYLLADRLLRPALVTVACAANASRDEQDAPGCQDEDRAEAQPQDPTTEAEQDETTDEPGDDSTA